MNSKLVIILLLTTTPLLKPIKAENEESVDSNFLPVKVVKETADVSWDVNTLDFTAISERLLQQRASASGISSSSSSSNDSLSLVPAPFPGPDLLSPLLAQCFLFDDQRQYIFRVCPFANVTQHEKSAYAFNFLTTSFHAVLGVYRRWYVSTLDDFLEGESNSTASTASATSASFDSLLYLEGDQCDQGVARQVRLRLLCSTDWTMLDLAYLVNVSEVARCRYQATLASPLFCQLGTVQSRLGPEGQNEWAVLEALLRGGLITRAGYEHYLEALLNRYGLTAKDEVNSLEAKDFQKVNSNSGGNNSTSDKQQLHSCEQRVQQLEREVAELQAQINNKQ